MSNFPASGRDFFPIFLAAFYTVLLNIQVALSVADEEKRLQETNSFSRIKDSFSKLVLVKEPIIPWQDENGVRYMGIQEWLKDSGKFSERKDI